MKNLSSLFALLIVTFFAANISAQSTTFGVRAGLNLANVSVDADGNSVSFDSRAGFTLAGLANIGVSDAFSIQPELHFIQKGYETEFEFFGTTTEQKIRLNYLELPIHAKYGFSIADNVGGFVMAGPALGFALGGKFKICEDGNCETEDIEFDDDDGFNRFEVGLSLGGGVSFGDIFVDIRYVLGLTNLAEEDAMEEGFKTTNRGFQVGVGYMFGGE